MRGLLGLTPNLRGLICHLLDLKIDWYVAEGNIGRQRPGISPHSPAVSIEIMIEGDLDWASPSNISCISFLNGLVEHVSSQR
jgi:hypothetical protein